MFRTPVFLLILFWFICLSDSVPTPAKCETSDSKCLRDAARAFLPLLADGAVSPELKTLDPLLINKIESNSHAVRFLASNVKVKGLRECSVEKVSRDVDNSKMYIDVLCSLSVDGQYEIKGKVKTLPLDGQGLLAVSFTNIFIRINVDLDNKELGGQKYLNIKNWSLDYIIKDKANVKLSNLFNGKVKPTPEIQETLGASFTELIGEISPPIIKAIVNEGMDTIRNYFYLVPTEDFSFE